MKQIIDWIPTKVKIGLGLLLVQVLIFYNAKPNSGLIHFHEKLFAFFNPIWQKLFSGFTFSVGDWFYIALGLVIVVLLYLKKATFWILINCLFFFYQLSWGILYAYPPISDKLKVFTYTKTDLKKMTDYYLIQCLKTKDSLNLQENQLKTHLYTSLKNLPTEFQLFPRKTSQSLKASLFGKLMSYTGISGYYNPFTAEAQYNSNLPKSLKAFTLSHEMAHQLGYAREQEASFIGYLILKNSRNRDLEYAANWYNLKRLLRELEPHDRVYTRLVQEKFNPQMKRYWGLEQKFYTDHHSFWEDVFSTTNDWFLKLNKQEGSITYSYYLELLMRYEKEKEKESYTNVRFQKHK